MKDLKINNSAKSITGSQYQQFITEFNLKLPDSYKQFILKHNGGYPQISAFKNPNEDGIEIQNFNRISLNNESFLEERNKVISSRSIIQSHQVIEENIPSYFYPFGLAPGGAFLCISMKNSNFGSVFTFYLDGTAEEPTFLASSFEEFINSLEDPEMYEEN